MKFLLFTALLLNIVSNQAASLILEPAKKTPTGAIHHLFVPGGCYVSVLSAKADGQHIFTTYKTALSAGTILPDINKLQESLDIPFSLNLEITFRLIHAHTHS